MWLLVSVEWARVGTMLWNGHWWVLIPATLLIAFQMICRGIRWRFLLPDQAGPHISTRVLVDSIMVGNMASYVLPLRAGEFIRPLLLSFQSSYPFSTTFVSVVIERFFDLSAVLLTFGIVLFFVPEVPDWAFHGAVGLSIVALAIFLFMLAGSILPKAIMGVAEYVLRFLPAKFQASIHRLLTNLLNGARVLRKPVNLAAVTGLTLVVWLSTYALYYTFLFFFEIDPSFSMAATVTVFVALAVAAPSAPGFVGVYQIGCMAGFKLFNVDVQVAAAFAILTHVVQYVAIVSYGGYALWKTDWSLADLMKRSNAPQPEEDAAATGTPVIEQS